MGRKRARPPLTLTCLNANDAGAPRIARIAGPAVCKHRETMGRAAARPAALGLFSPDFPPERRFTGPFKKNMHGVMAVTGRGAGWSYFRPIEMGKPAMYTDTYRLNRTADRIAGAAALLVAAVIAAPVILLALTPFIG
jgi:hypothetical protein